MCTSINESHDKNDSNSSQMWIASLVATRVSCMHTISFVKNMAQLEEMKFNNITSQNMYE